MLLWFGGGKGFGGVKGSENEVITETLELISNLLFPLPLLFFPVAYVISEAVSRNVRYAFFLPVSSVS